MMKAYKKHFLLLALIFVATTATSSNVPQQNTKVPNDYKSAVKAFLKASDYEQSLRDNLRSLFAQMGSENQQVNGLIDYLANEMPNRMVDIYYKYLTIDDINQLTEINKDVVYAKFRNLQSQVNNDLILEGQCYATGKPSPSANITVSSAFEKVMKQYLKVTEFEKQEEQMRSVMGLNIDDALYNQLPDLMVKIYSKYFTQSEIEKLMELHQLPSTVKFRKKAPEFAQDTMDVTQTIMMNYLQNVGF